MSYYERHIFFCCNQREGTERTEDVGIPRTEMVLGKHSGRHALKQRVKELGLAEGTEKRGRLRVNQAGCLDRCEEGPCVVVYPEAVWYTYVDRADIDEIVEEHLRNGRIVERLRI